MKVDLSEAEADVVMSALACYETIDADYYQTIGDDDLRLALIDSAARKVTAARRGRVADSIADLIDAGWSIWAIRRNDNEVLRYEIRPPVAPCDD